MQKIPTIFDRGKDFKVVDSPRKGCLWVFAGEGFATEKLDGTNVRLTVRGNEIVRLEKRRNPSKVQKEKGIFDAWYVDADQAATSDKWIFEAGWGTDITKWHDGEYICEALGPKIQGNPLNLKEHICVWLNVVPLVLPVYHDAPRNYAGLAAFLANLESKFSPGNLAEGIVFHHFDRRLIAKIKRKDFPRP